MTKAKRSLPLVARSRRFQQALARRLRVLDRDLPAALDQDVEALHRTRVASRRLREALPVLEAPGAERQHARKRVRKLTRALGGVRELDVALALLGEIRTRQPQLSAVVDTVQAEIHNDRATRYVDMLRRLEGISPGRLTRDLQSAADAAETLPRADQAQRLSRRVARRAVRLEKMVEAAGSLYAFDRLHLVRIAAKKLRYSLELVGELTAIGTQRLVERLKATQDLLGRLHDLEIVAGYVRRLAGRPDHTLSSDGAKLLDVIEGETRELHAEYLQHSGTLRAVVAASRDQICPRLQAMGGARRATP